MSPVEPEQAMKVGSVVEHREVIMQAGYPVAVAVVVGTLFMIKDLMQIETWRGRLVVYISRMSTGIAAAYLAVLSVSYIGLDATPETKQIAAIAGYTLGHDFLDGIARRFFGFKTRSGD